MLRGSLELSMINLIRGDIQLLGAFLVNGEKHKLGLISEEEYKRLIKEYDKYIVEFMNCNVRERDSYDITQHKKE